jgi:hypothetical protein
MNHVKFQAKSGAPFLIAVALLSAPLRAQDATFGVAMPVTLSANLMTTHRRQTFAPKAGNLEGGFRANFYPTVKLGPHWYAYSAIQVNSYPLFYYETYYPSRNVDTSLIQAFVAYTQSSAKSTLSIKAGRLASAFGSFPLRYDDTVNPLLDLPLNYYGSYVALRPDRLPCGVAELLRQRSYRFAQFSCGGSAAQRPNIWPVTLYGLPAVQADFAFHNLDARLQLTNSSPANPQTLLSGSQHVQWTAGTGYTFWQGFRAGFSAFRGPFLEKSVSAFLPAGEGVRDYPAAGVGVDAQWARGRWSANGEWSWIEFQYPAFRTSPAVSSGYAETKVILTPRFYAAVRASFLHYNLVLDQHIRSSEPFQPEQQAYEFALGFHVNHFQTLKLGYEWAKTYEISGSRDNVFGMQFVTSIDSLYKAFK